MRKSCLLAAAAIALFLTFGCAGPRNLFVLLPDSDGQVGRILVSNPSGSQELSRANEAVAVESVEKAPGVPFQMEDREIEKVFGQALAAQPPPPLHFILYFKRDSTDLTDESQRMIPRIVEAIRERRSEDTSVVGHTDTVGDQAYNYNLSLRRAKMVAKMLQSQGVDPAILEITSHGKMNPMVPTGDNVPEPRNRRVEITVR